MLNKVCPDQNMRFFLARYGTQSELEIVVPMLVFGLGFVWEMMIA